MQIDRVRRAVIRRMRNEQHASFKQIAKFLNCSRRSVHRICANERGRDDLDEDTTYLKMWDAVVTDVDSFDAAAVPAGGLATTSAHTRDCMTKEEEDSDDDEVGTSSEEADENSDYKEPGSGYDSLFERRVSARLRHEAPPLSCTPNEKQEPREQSRANISGIIKSKILTTGSQTEKAKMKGVRTARGARRHSHAQFALQMDAETGVVLNTIDARRATPTPTDARSPRRQSVPLAVAVAGTLEESPVAREMVAEPGGSANGSAEPKIMQVRSQPLLPLQTAHLPVSQAPLTQSGSSPSTSIGVASQRSLEPPRFIRKPSASPRFPTPLLDSRLSPETPLKLHSQHRVLEFALSRRALPIKRALLVDRATSTAPHVETLQSRLVPDGSQVSLTKRKREIGEDGECADEQQRSGKLEPKRTKFAPDVSRTSAQVSDVAVTSPRSSAGALGKIPQIRVSSSTRSRKLEVELPSPPTDHGSHCDASRVRKVVSMMDTEHPQTYSNFRMATPPSGATPSTVSAVRQSLDSANCVDEETSCDVASAHKRPVLSPSPSDANQRGSSRGHEPSGLRLSAPVKGATPTLIAGGNGAGLAGPHQGSVDDSHSAQTILPNPLPNAPTGIDPDVAQYVKSLGLPPEVYASKLELVGLKNGIILNATKNFVPDSRKDKLEEDLQKLAGLTVAESMILISGLRRPANG
ncbi:uncharacterized protein B0H18DRAFT_1120253 [Fomitopsis serialis]|uniref:uncharacterized protein n=1 Tax=Fomitopsis serialis TaxID=139415 RepID=UPI002007C1AF|nr:uncharacterized protein B0H18DRAFT_1120253 [Neoantrodia serialis]KAH9923593.1 hypothetical protein B0H18DRAFT_1120253 [Neoantrodia serialis]